MVGAGVCRPASESVAHTGVPATGRYTRLASAAAPHRPVSPSPPKTPTLVHRTSLPLSMAVMCTAKLKQKPIIGGLSNLGAGVVVVGTVGMCATWRGGLVATNRACHAAARTAPGHLKGPLL